MTKFVYKSIIYLAFMFCTFASIGQNSKYYDYAGKFKILFLGTPTATSSNISTEMGQVTLYQFMLETNSSVFMVSYVDYPADQMVNQDKKELLKNAKGGFVKSLSITISDEGFITYAKHQGLWFHADNGKIFSSMRDYLVDNRLYQLGILQYGAISEKSENDFFDSFELVK